MAIKIFVEGIADQKFLKDFVEYKYKTDINQEDIIATGGWTKFTSEGKDGEVIRNKMTQNSDNEGTNLLIFDADDDFNDRKGELEDWRNKWGLDFEIYLWPNNSGNGDLEVLLENIINRKNQPVFDCWNQYEKCLQSETIEGCEVPLTTPARKTKIYGYLEVLLGDSKNQKEKIKERNRDYKKADFWDLDSEYLNVLSDFLDSYFK
ncbi:MAG: hypothetical protein N4A49_01195 [Marinifilaceae bacterium]|jgi:hypothetical protein|nr:hypothetical protein [Marinifilaceae bacterium]